MNHDEYICRAKITREGKWVYGYYIGSIDGKHYLVLEKFSDVANPRSIPIVPIDPATLCRCTGIKDKAEKRIFENDMLDEPYNIVSYQSNLNEGLGMNCGWYLQRDNFESWRELQAEQYYEIIGNTIDNPELLQARR